MKKKLGLLIISTVAVLSLTACEGIHDIFNNFPFGQPEDEYSYTEINDSTSSSGDDSIYISPSEDFSSSVDTSSDSESSSSSQDEEPLPEPSEITPQKASCTYEDYVKNNVYSVSSTPSVGEAHILVIPVWFSDSNNYISSSKKENVRQDIEKAYFGKNTDTGWRSVKTYYEEESHGVLTLTGKVTDWYTDSRSYTSYGPENSGMSLTQNLVKTATKWYFDNNPSDSRRNYDKDGDGYLDGVMLIYGAPDYSVLKNERYGNLWAYCYWLQEPSSQNVTSPGANAYFWASFDFMYGREVYASRTGVSSKQYPSGDTAHVTIDTHTYIHEMGHMFHLEDYYDYSTYGYSPAGGFSMQDNNVGGHDPFSIFALGWGKAYIPTESVTINLKPLTTSGEMIILTPSWNEYNSPFDEYLIVEYFTPDGVNYLDTKYSYASSSGKQYPTGSQVSGVRVWHVDARLLYTKTGDFKASNWTTNPNISNQTVSLMMSNTYDDGKNEYITPLGSSYANYNLLQMIRNNKTVTHKNKNHMDANSLFRAKDTFSMSDFSRQFVNSGRLNNGSKNLGFSFKVNGLTDDYASITITKL